MFEALGRFVHRFRWIVIGVWVALFGVSVVAAPLLGDVLRGSFANPDAPSQQAAALVQEKFQQGPTSVLVIFKDGSLDAAGAEFQAAQKQSLDQLAAAQIPGLQSVQTYASTGSDLLLSRDRRTSVAVLNFDAPLEIIQNQIERIREALEGGALQTYVTGEPAVNADLTTYSFRDLQKVELYGLPVALIALLFVFGSLVSAALPVITGGLAVTVTLGGLYLLGRLMDMSIFTMNTATLLGLAVAIDYALFFVSRFREELHKGASAEEAVVTTTARAGRSVLYSGIAVIVGVAGLLFFPSPGLRSVGIGGALVVFFSVAASLTFIPALLSVLGRRVNLLPVLPIRDVHASRFWNWWSRRLLKRPWVGIVVSLVLIGLLVAPVLTLKTEMTTANTLPKAAESRLGIEILDQEFDRAALSPVSVLLTWDGDGQIDVSRAAALFMYGQQLTGLQGVGSVTSPFTLGGLGDSAALAAFWPQFERLLNDPAGFVVPEAGITLDSGVTITAAQLEQFRQLVQGSVAPGAVLFRVVAQDAPGSAAAQDLVGRIMATAAPAGYVAHVAGESAYNYDFFKELSDWFPWVILWVFLSSFVIFVVLLRSLALPALAVVVNVFTVGMSYGLLVLLFQGDTFQNVLRFTPTGAIEVIIPIVLLCNLFGITMDYAVFMLTRSHECWERTADNRRSVATGLIQTGRVIVSAALLVVIVTGAFTFTNIRSTKMLGMGVALAIIVDTILIRMTLLPSMMAYLGRLNWWWPLVLSSWKRGGWARAKRTAPDSQPE
jgi:putative drug exporter of the RND superfamily